jgi:hypothetical protein
MGRRCPIALSDYRRTDTSWRRVKKDRHTPSALRCSTRLFLGHLRSRRQRPHVPVTARGHRGDRLCQESRPVCQSHPGPETTAASASYTPSCFSDSDACRAARGSRGIVRPAVRAPPLSDPSDAAATVTNMPAVGDPDRSRGFRDGLLEAGRPAECVIAASHDRARTMAYRFGGGGRGSTAYRGSPARLRRIRMRGNSPARVWALLAFALLLVFVVIPWVIRHPLPRHEHLFGVSERHQRR